MKTENNQQANEGKVVCMQNINGLCDMFEVSRFVMNNMVAAMQAELGEKVGRYFSIVQVQQLIDRYGAKGYEHSKQS
jgi:hypothetical protein